MIEKPKRKNDEPIPRCYWWIFGILAIVMLIGLRFPVRILYWWELNPILYGLIALACLLATVSFIRRFHWKRYLVIVMLVCNLLAGLHFDSSQKYLPYTPGHCESRDDELIVNTFCYTAWRYFAYISVMDLPVAIETRNEFFTCCSLF